MKCVYNNIVKKEKYDVLHYYEKTLYTASAAGVGVLFVALMAFFKGRRKNRSAK